MSSYADRARGAARRMAFRLRQLRDERGSAAAEFAMVMPLFLTIIIGTVEFGRVLQQWSEISHAVSRASREVQLDATKTPEQVSGLLRDYLKGTEGFEEMSIKAESISVSDTDYIKMGVSTPFQTFVKPFPKFTISADAMTPVLSPEK